MTGNPVPFTKRFTQPFRPGGIRPDASGSGRGGGFRFDWARLLPRVTLYLHLSQDTLIRDRGGVARWEGHGPVTAQYVTEHLAPYHRFDIHPVIDLATMAPVDAYEIPDRHRRAVHLISPADIFPYSTNTSTTKQVDHTTAYRPRDRGGGPGQSRIGNYGPMTRFHHAIKTFGPWQLRQPFPGIYLWRTPHGQHYLVDHTGTRKITGETDDRGAGRNQVSSGPHNPDLEVHVHPGRQPLDYQHTHTG